MANPGEPIWQSRPTRGGFCLRVQECRNPALVIHAKIKIKDHIMIGKENWHNGKVHYRGGDAGGIWFLGFIGALVYFFHSHPSTFWLVILAILKAIVWPAFLVYYLFTFLKI